MCCYVATNLTHHPPSLLSPLSSLLSEPSTHVHVSDIPPSQYLVSPAPLPAASPARGTNRVRAVEVRQQFDLEEVVTARLQGCVPQQDGRARGERLVTDDMGGPKGDGPGRPIAVPAPGQPLCRTRGKTSPRGVWKKYNTG